MNLILNIMKQSEQKFNTEKMSILCDNIIRALVVINKNKDIYNNNKEEMIKIVERDNQIFYNNYPRVCRTLVFNDIEPLIGMIKQFAKVQAGEISYEKADNMIKAALNSQYVDPVLNSEKLVKEREEKQKNEKIIDITEK